MTQVNLSIGFSGFRVHSYWSIDQIVDVSVKAERFGFRSAWVPDNHYTNDAFSPLSLIGSMTRKLRLATGIVNPFTRHPVVIAMTACAIDEMSNGRMVLGIGLSPKILIEDQMGIPVGNPVNCMRETVQVLRRLIRGERVTYSGSFLHLNGVKLDNPPRNIPIYIAAIGPQMLRLAGEIGEGVILTDLCSAEYVKYAVGEIRKGAKRRSGNDPEIKVACYSLISLDRRNLDLHKKAIAYFFPRIEQVNLVAMGTELDPGRLRRMGDFSLAGKMELAASEVSNELAEHCSIIGTPEECRRRVEDYLRAGVEELVLCPLQDQVEGVMRLFGPPHSEEPPP